MFASYLKSCGQPCNRVSPSSSKRFEDNGQIICQSEYQEELSFSYGRGNLVPSVLSSLFSREGERSPVNEEALDGGTAKPLYTATEETGVRV